MSDFCSALLVGGRSQRMGQDKAFLDWHGLPLWIVQAKKLLSAGSQTVYLAARNEQNFEALIQSHLSPDEAHRLSVIEDPQRENCGPIGAISRCLASAQMPLLVLAVDLPLMTAEFLRHRVVISAPQGKGLFYNGKHGPEVLGGLYVPKMLPRMDQALRAGDYSIQALVSHFVKVNLCDVREPETDELHLWSNANTPEEAAQILRFKP